MLSPSVSFDHLDNTTRIIVCFAIFLVVLIIGTPLFRMKYFSGNTWFENKISPNGSISVAFANKHNQTKQEKTILVSLAERLSYEETAEELFIVQSTVRSHVGHVFEKSEVHTRWEFDQKYHEYKSI